MNVNGAWLAESTAHTRLNILRRSGSHVMYLTAEFKNFNNYLRNKFKFIK